MEILSFMYSEKLSITSPTLLLDVLIAIEKLEVVSCMQYCNKPLGRLTMTTKSALLYLDLPYHISLASADQPLIDVAKDILANRYKAIAKFQDEITTLPLAGIEAILSSDGLQATSEDAIWMALWLAASSERLRLVRQLLQWPMEEFDRLRSKHVSLVNQVMNPGGFFHVNNNDTVPADLDVTFEISHSEKNRGF
ncbi:hypothetical protein ZIOFF_069442 [Zingiber officinale]|uniref:Uncharacterized protein n=1 Tax=Zingiber officinale TaxID=94328 RepID=A0A8J5CBQ4_ZINOF|nr:hypothetical protein ZIOFF_069442 [Zingiber officinale]